jgi:hypothetical protein
VAAKSKFAEIISSRLAEPPEAPPVERVEKELPVPLPTQTPVQDDVPTVVRPNDRASGGSSDVRGTARTVGRPAGKRSDPDWKQFSVLLKRNTHRKVADKLRNLDEEKATDFSGLVQKLLEDWLKRENS